jgi:hypothetical protein
MHPPWDVLWLWFEWGVFGVIAAALLGVPLSLAGYVCYWIALEVKAYRKRLAIRRQEKAIATSGSDKQTLVRGSKL